MAFDRLHAVPGRKPHRLDHMVLPGRYADRIGTDKLADINRDGQRTVLPLQTLRRLTGACKLRFLESLQGVILRNGLRHLEAARRHTNIVVQREKQADRIGVMAASVLARANGSNDETR
ncbi:MAG TPA: hypothetical protein VIF02_01390 [Methylocella sp.]|jgi:hypothetical protein